MIKLGVISETYDEEGPLFPQEIEKFPSLEEVKNILQDFQGEVFQKPPLYSNIKIKGKPAHFWARLAQKIELPPKKVFIKSINLLDYQPPFLKIKVITGSGVYLRSLAHDLGQRLKTGAYLAGLKRLRIGDYFLESAVSFEDFDQDFFELFAEFFGLVQGVNFRSFVKKNADFLNLKGWVRNTERNTVEVVAQGGEKSLQLFLLNLKKGPPLARVEKVFSVFKKPLNLFEDFFIRYN